MQVKGLHDEVMAQRALDRRLTEELVRFKRAISSLTAELTDVKEHEQQSSAAAAFSREEVSPEYAAVAKTRSIRHLVQATGNH